MQREDGRGEALDDPGQFVLFDDFHGILGVGSPPINRFPSLQSRTEDKGSVRKNRVGSASADLGGK